MTTKRIAPPSDAQLWVERTGERTYLGRSASGSTVLMGPEGTAGGFTPGELLQLALAGCAGMSSDLAASRRLGPDAPRVIVVSATKHETEDRYAQLHETVLMDYSALDGPAQDQLLTTVNRAIGEHCTVGLTLEHAAAIDRTVVNTPAV
ncbi:MAG: OsmC family protein [Bifidobacteriaceae bacterium]|jgi:uncharacterized OsmC-like protein|nr:OsmC family protein [Bifidobacteriaceae bacterium]